MMEHSVDAYLKRLPTEKIRVLLEQLEKDDAVLMDVSPELLETLRRKVGENA